MPQQDTTELKGKIVSILKQRGPSLPVHVARETGLSILFASAFLSELAADKAVKISHMKVGSSPIYFIPTHFGLLERFSNHLKSKEKDAFELLKAKKFLQDSIQQPAIRVALRALKDFAVPFEKNSELYWRYFTTPESELKVEPIKLETTKTELMVPLAIKLKIEQDGSKTKKSKQQELNIFDKSKNLKKDKKKTISNTSDKFFNKVKEHLNKNNVEIIDILDFSKSQIVLKIKDSTEKILICYNKKRISDSEIIKAHKISKDYELPYSILFLGEPTKKFSTLISAIKDLQGLEKI